MDIVVIILLLLLNTYCIKCYNNVHVIVCLLGFDCLDLLCFVTLFLCYKYGLVFDWQRALFYWLATDWCLTGKGH